MFWISRYSRHHHHQQQHHIRAISQMHHFTCKISLLQRTMQNNIIYIYISSGISETTIVSCLIPIILKPPFTCVIKPPKSPYFSEQYKTLFACVMLFSVMCWAISREDISLKVPSYRRNNLIGHRCVQRYDEIRSTGEGGGGVVRRDPGAQDYYTLLIVGNPLLSVCFLRPKEQHWMEKKRKWRLLVSMATDKHRDPCQTISLELVVSVCVLLNRISHLYNILFCNLEAEI